MGEKHMSQRPQGKRLGKVLPCVLVDVNTQLDFLDVEGTCPVTNREILIPELRRTIAWAKRNHVPVISAIDCHRPEEVRHVQYPRHCLDGTPGQKKIGFTLFGSYVMIEGDNTLSVPIDLFRKHQQVIFRKRTADFFLNPKADRFITQLPAAEYMVMGLGMEGAVRAIALGLLSRNKRVTVVHDACGYFDASEADLATRLLEAKGAELISVADLLRRKLPRPIRYPLTAAGQVSVRNGLYAAEVYQPSANNGHSGPGANGHNGYNGHGHSGVRINKNASRLRPNRQFGE
jgi:nicotinamidase-related amidase